jgi:hypothetical protein
VNERELAQIFSKIVRQSVALKSLASIASQPSLAHQAQGLRFIGKCFEGRFSRISRCFCEGSIDTFSANFSSEAVLHQQNQYLIDDLNNWKSI